MVAHLQARVYASVNSKREHPPPPPPGTPRGAAPISFRSWECVLSELPGVARGVGPIIKVPSCQLDPLFSYKLIHHLLLLSSY